jgi:hypothetical protein
VRPDGGQRAGVIEAPSASCPEVRGETTPLRRAVTYGSAGNRTRDVRGGHLEADLVEDRVARDGVDEARVGEPL